MQLEITMALAVIGACLSFFEACMTVFWCGLWAWWKYEDVKLGEGRMFDDSLLVFVVKVIGMIGAVFLARFFIGGDVRSLADEGQH